MPLRRYKNGARLIRRLFEERRPVSPTAVERWAGCPFRYFVDRVLEVEPTARPEETWTINPLDDLPNVSAAIEISLPSFLWASNILLEYFPMFERQRLAEAP